MNIQKIKSLLGKLTFKIKNLKTEIPKKYKYIIVSGTGVIVITLTVVLVSNYQTAVLKDSDPAPNALNSSTYSQEQTTADTFSADTSAASAAADTATKKSVTLSRGSQSNLDPLKGDIIKTGVKDSIVTVIQKKLMELDYIETDEPTEEYGETLAYAIQLFQRKNELKMTGEVDAETYKLLISENAKKYTVSLGDDGTDVEQLQQRLYELGYLNKVTGHFGSDTESAVKTFQKRNGLYDDGNVGSQTREALYSAEAVPMSYYLGDKNDEILKYQQRLTELGYLTTKPDGKYGDDTVAAVKRFQDNNGLIADGYMGPATKELLMSGDASENALDIGDSGDDVTNVQNYLKKLGYLRGSTGYFGSDTHEAVLNFQKRNGLKADGKVGSQTINQLLSPDAKRWNGGSGSSGSSGGSGSGSSGGSSSGGSTVNTTSPNADLFVSIAKSKLGAKYVYGAKGPSTFDCSGFVYWVLKQAGVRQSYMTSASWNVTGRYQKITSMSSIKKGDVITFRGHVGIALGNNQMIDASSSQGKVRITNLSSSYWTRNFVNAFRIF